jgi:hypothetical protein
VKRSIVVTDPEIDDMLHKAARAPHAVEPAVLARITDSIHSSLQPVRPLPPGWLLTIALVLICAAVALAGAWRAGFYGVEKMGVWERVAIFSTLVLLASLTAREFVAQWLPGSRHHLAARTLLVLASALLLGLFGLLFHDYHTEHFVQSGVICLLTGLLHAIPAAFLSGWLLRRGFAVTPVSAGLIGGTLGGLTGVTLLELHCPNFEALHILVWHVAVVPVSAAIGALAGWALSTRRRALKCAKI